MNIYLLVIRTASQRLRVPPEKSNGLVYEKVAILLSRTTCQNVELIRGNKVEQPPPQEKVMKRRAGSFIIKT